MKVLLFLFFIFLSGCSVRPGVESVSSVFSQSGFSAYQIQAEPFILTSYERVVRNATVAHVYIEGDGRAWLSKNRPSLDPTPKNPLAFKLAQLDPAENVIYLARPCQYTNGTACDSKYWTSHRFAPDVMEAMNNALDNMKRRHHIEKLHLIGYSGGGNIAALLTAKRNDVLSLRTVAGNLNHKLQSEIHGVSLMPNSLNARDIAAQINHIPQIHYVGEADKVVPQSIADSYLKASDYASEVQVKTITDVSHQKGWDKVWLSLLARVNL